ncbi:MAG: S8 family serine peptidase [Bacteroidia bacterium]|nr:S8 family serine peptidase [Bacteroidia bacterium]
MKTNFFYIIIYFLIVCDIHSQTAPGKYWIRFTDKYNNDYYIEDPEAFLSEEAIQRRQNQDIAIVENDLPVTTQYIDSLRNLGLNIINISKWFNAVTIESTDTVLLDTITQISFIAGKEKVLRIKTNPDRQEPVNYDISNYLRNIYSELGVAVRCIEPVEISQSNCRTKTLKTAFNYGPAAHQLEMLNGHLLHDIGYQGQGIKIAIIDAGYLYLDVHPVFDSLRNSGRILSMRDFVDGDNDVISHHTHGMNVLSTMAAWLDGQMVGTAPKASYLLLRSEDASSEYRIEEDNWISAAEFADSAGADIINTSLGYNLFNDSIQDYSISELDGNTARITVGADIAASKGILVVVSAGNDGASAWHYINFPADADSILSIGAINADSSYTFFSSTGPTADGRIKPDIVAQGKDTYIANSIDGFAVGNGTSFSSPIITGLAACLWQAHPEVPNMQLIEAIRQSADQYQNPDSLKGYGIPDFYMAHNILNIIKISRETGNDIVKLYPNPFISSLNLEYYSPDTQEVKIEIYDISGRIIMSFKQYIKPLSRNLIYIAPSAFLQSGIYIVNIFSNKGIQNFRIIKC